MINQKKGFTLIELMVVISIISLLSSVVLSSLNEARAKGRDAARIRAMVETRTALQLYFTDNGEYPYNTYGVGGVDNKIWVGLLVPTYIKSIPPEIRYWSTVSPWGSGTCDDASTCTGYIMTIKLEKKNNVLNSDADRNQPAMVLTVPSSPAVPDGVSKLTDCVIDDSAVANDTDLCYDIKI